MCGKLKGFPHRAIVAGCLWMFCMLISITGFAAEEKEKAKKHQASVQACEYVADLANKGRLQEVLMKFEYSRDIKIPKNLSGAVSTRIIDINNDGIMERVFVESQGTAHFESFSVYKLETDEAIELKPLWDDNWSDDKERWAADRAFFEYQGVNYILGKTDQSLSYLLYVNPQNEIQVVCEFGQREQATLQLVRSQNDRVCNAVLQDQISYVEYDRLHSLSYNEVRNSGLPETSPGGRAAWIDIDNDGKKEMVVTLSLSSGRGRGCAMTFPAVLTPDRASIDKSYNKKFPPGDCNGTQVKPFVFDGKTYLDERQTGAHAQHRQVYMLDKSDLKTICEFDVRPENYVQGAVESIEKAAQNRGDLWEYVISRGDVKAVDTLINEGRHLNEAIKAQKEVKPYCRFPIGVALQYKQDDILEKLLRAGADPNLVGEKEAFHSNLATAVFWGTPTSIRVLIRYGAKDIDGPLSALSMAVRQDSLEKLEVLLNAGIRISDSVAVEAVEARDKNKYERLKLLVRYGLDPKRICSKYVPIQGIVQESPGVWKVGPEVKTRKVDITLLQLARELGDPEIIRILGGPDEGKSHSD